MSDRIVVVATQDNPVDVAAVTAVPLQIGHTWGPGLVRGTRRYWSFWIMQLTLASRAELQTLATAGVCRVHVWDAEREHRSFFLNRWQSQEGVV